VLDLLCKKVSPNIISGLIINQGHRCKPNCCESFLTQIVKKENATAFIKLFSDRPSAVRKGGLSKLEASMRSMHVNKLLLLPRISASVKKSLDAITGLQVAERAVKFSATQQEMHHLLIRIMQACLDEA